MTDKWAERLNALTTFANDRGFAALAFVLIFIASCWFISRQLTIAENQSKAHVAALEQLTTSAKKQQTDFTRLIEFTTQVTTDHADAAAERAVIIESLRELVEHLTKRETGPNPTEPSESVSTDGG